MEESHFKTRIIVRVSLVPFFPPNDSIDALIPWHTRKDQILRFVEWMKKTMFPKRKPQTRLVINLVLAWQFSRRAIPRGPRGFLSWRILTFPEFWLGIVEIPEKLLTISKQPSSPWPGFLGVARRDIPRQFLYIL